MKFQFNNLTFRTSAIIICTLLFTLSSKATTYYISSNNGDNSNIGTTPSLPWETLDKVNSFSFVSGDSILFERNNIWRGQLIPKSGSMNAVVYYGAYSNGNLPAILGSLNFTKTSDWTNTAGNIWKCNTSFSTDIGNVIFNNATSVGLKKWSLNGLQNQSDFWFDMSSNELYLYSAINPANIYSEIELALRKNIIEQENTSYVTYENLSLKYGGAHGIGGGNTSNISIKALEISYIGGGDLFLNGTTRYGNGVEFWGNASNNIVEKCKIWEIYDTGVTNQNNNPNTTQQNIKYQNNIIWNCGLASFEYWNRPSTSTTLNIHFENNTCLHAGYGWGTQRPDYHGMHIELNTSTAQTDNIFIRNNIFYNAKRFTYAIEDSINRHVDLDYNIIYQSSPIDSIFISFPSYNYYIYSDFSAYTSSTHKDLNSLTGNPDFTNLSGNDLTLLNGSIAIDAGKYLDIQDDFNGNPRPINEIFDIGAYEYSKPVSTHQTKHLNPAQIYPNPTNKYFRISLGENKIDYTLNVYSISGQKILSIDDYLSKNPINVEHLNNGVYWIILNDENQTSKIGKLIIQK